MAIGAFAFLQRPSQDIPNEGRFDARYVGNLDVGRSSIGIRSDLSVGDKVDQFRFRMLNNANLSLSSVVLQPAATGSGVKTDPAPDGTTRIQILGVGGRIIADSNPNAGSAFAAYQKLTSTSNIQLQKGDYTVKITRGPASRNNTDYTYLVSLRTGPIGQPVDPASKDMASRYFETDETPPPPQVAADPGSSDLVTGIFDGMASGDPVTGIFTGLVNTYA